jgi:hypothetical protein
MPFDNNGWNQYDALIAGTRGVSNPGTDTVQTGMGSTQGRNAQAFQPSEYEARLQQMMSPYQDMANKVYGSPYAMIGKENGFLAQHLGSAAGPVDNALLAGAMTPEARGPEGVGGGISRALQGVLGANQYQRNRAMQAAMLPYQLIEPKLKALDTMAQIDQRSSMMTRNNAYVDSVVERNRHDIAMEQVASGRLDQAAAKDRMYVGSDGQNYEQTANGMVGLNSRQPVPPDSKITFTAANRPAGGSTELERTMDMENRERAAKGQAPLTSKDVYDRMAQVAGMKTFSSTVNRDRANDPTKQDENFQQEEIHNYQANAPGRPMNESTFAKAKMDAMLGLDRSFNKYNPSDTEAKKGITPYDKYVEERETQNEAYRNVQSNWMANRKNLPNKRMGITDFAKKYGSQATQPGFTVDPNNPYGN